VPVKSVISVEVQDESFSKFHEKFSAYLGELDEQQEKWEKAGQAMGLSGEALAGGAINAKESLAVAAAQAGVISEALRDAVRAQNDLGGATKRSGEHMGKLHTAAKGVGGAIASIGGWLVKIAAFGGLGGILSGIGVADLAGYALGRSKAAGQLGMSPGSLASFQINAQRFLGTDALQSTFIAQHDYNAIPALASLGFDVRKAQAQDTGDLAIEALQKSAARYNQDQKTGLKQNSDWMLKLAMGTFGFSLGEIANAASHPGALAAVKSNYHSSRASLEFGKRNEEAWDKLTPVLELASEKIKTVFVTGLAGLTPEITRLANSFSGFVTNVLESPNAKNAIDALAKDFDMLGNTLASKGFAENVERVVGVFAWAADKFKYLPGTGGPTDKLLDAVEQPKYSPFNANILGNVGAKAAEFVSGLKGAGTRTFENVFGHNQKETVQKLMDIATRMGVAPELALATAGWESTHSLKLNPFAKGDNGTSFGLFQLHQGGELGNLTPKQAYDVGINTRRALSEFAIVGKWSKEKQLNRFSEAVRYAMTHYDDKGKQFGPTVSHNDIMALFGSGGVRSALSQRPGDPYDYAIGINNNLKALAQHASRQAAKPIQKKPTVIQKTAMITITNQTSARVAVSMNAAAIA